MGRDAWEEIRLPAQRDSSVWELFHDNSKTCNYNPFLPEAAVAARMLQMAESLPFHQYPAIELPTSRSPMSKSLEEAILTRATGRRLEPVSLTMENLATILHYAYGVTHDNTAEGYPRPFRVVPSGGALYPLEIFFYSHRVKDLEAGVYHYDPIRNNVSLIRQGNQSVTLSEALVQGNLATDASLLFMITAMFERSTFKYGERGYRFVFLEAGHVGQNLTLTANGLGLGATSIGGFYDRKIDEFLGLDGITHSTIYMLAVGKNNDSSAGPESGV